MNRFETLIEFHRHFENMPGPVTINDIDRLKDRLTASGHNVKEYKNGAVVVRSPEDAKSAKDKRLAAQKKEAAKYTKLGAAVPVAKAKAFSDACRKLGISQSAVLLPVVDQMIELARSGGGNV
jgi:hypothetical protein